MTDQFDTLSGGHRASLKVSRSEFIGIAIPLEAEESFAAELQKVQKEFFDATHHCWGWRLFANGEERARSSDAGEPSGTAGKPILNAIVSAGLYDVAVIVVRYYGGVKLGTGGLARAYRDAAQLVLSTGSRSTRYLYDEIEVVVPFAELNNAYRLIDPPGVLLRSEKFEQENVFRYAVRRGGVEQFCARLKELQLQWRAGL